MNKTRRKTSRVTYMIVLLTVALLCCIACSSERKEEQLKYRESGITYMQNGKYEEALESFQKALDQSLGSIGEVELDICYYKAEAQYLAGDTQGAMDTYTAILNHKGDAKAYFLRGNLYYSLEDEANALKDYKAAVELEDKDYELYIGVYEALSAHGKDKEGQAYLNEALEIKGDKAYDKMQKGRINFLLGEETTAISLLEEAIQAKEMTAYYYLAEVNDAMGDDAAAESNMNAYIESGVADSYNLFNIANSQLGKGNYDMSITCLTAALELENVPNKQMIMKTLVIAYEQSGDYDLAKTVMADYVKAYPDDEEALREYTFLETR